MYWNFMSSKNINLEEEKKTAVINTNKYHKPKYENDMVNMGDDAIFSIQWDEK
jgi:hypothetical protein